MLKSTFIYENRRGADLCVAKGYIGYDSTVCVAVQTESVGLRVYDFSTQTTECIFDFVF